MRIYSEAVSHAAMGLLAELADRATTTQRYKAAMTGLGRELGARIAALLPRETPTVGIVCTVEDADFLARGLLEGLAASGVPTERIRLACFWNERVDHFPGVDEKAFDIAPIIKEYREHLDVGKSVLVMVKSIIASACVVKTNLAKLIEHAVPERVVVAAPVMLKGADERLASEFPKATADKFEYVTFATDDEEDAQHMVVPGIGGSVYARLGFANDGADKNRYVPDIVKERRRAYA